jgi:hypothetical protein
MTYFIRLADTYRVTATSAVNIQEKLPAGTYAVKVDDNGYFVELIKDFQLPKRLYGDTESRAKRIIDTFHDRPNSTGVFLEGEKGSGKTLLAKTISAKMREQGHPTLVVNAPHFGEGFNTFLQAISQPKVVIFDEFEKVYDEEDGAQERVLTLFDGVYPSKTLFIVTCNDSYRVDKNMKNRPGRMYYMLNFGGLDEDFIREYAIENLNDKTQIGSIVTAALLFRSFNFDMLQALVEEMNRYGETAQEAIKMLNAKPTNSKDTFDVTLMVAGKDVELPQGYDQWHGTPLTQDIVLYWHSPDRKQSKNYMFETSDLKNIDTDNGTFKYENDKGESCVLKRKKFEVYDYTHLL